MPSIAGARCPASASCSHWRSSMRFTTSSGSTASRSLPPMRGWSWARRSGSTRAWWDVRSLLGHPFPACAAPPPSLAITDALRRRRSSWGGRYEGSEWVS